MKKTLKKICFTSLALLIGANAFAWSWEDGGQGTLNGNTWYSLYDDTERSIYTINDYTYTGVQAPCFQLTFTAKRHVNFIGSGAGDLKIREYYNNNWSGNIWSQNPPNGTWTNYGPIDLNLETTQIKFLTEVGATYYKDFKNVRATQATYLEVTENSTITIPTITPTIYPTIPPLY